MFSFPCSPDTVHLVSRKKRRGVSARQLACRCALHYCKQKFKCHGDLVSEICIYIFSPALYTVCVFFCFRLSRKGVVIVSTPALWNYAGSFQLHSRNRQVDGRLHSQTVFWTNGHYVCIGYRCMWSCVDGCGCSLAMVTN